MKRTQIKDFVKIELASDLSEIVNDKRKEKRASKSKANRRNRHYEKSLLKQFSVKSSDKE